MIPFENLIDGLLIAAQPMNLLYALIGCVLGTLVGVLPGLGPAAGMALLLPVTFGMDPTSALIMLAGMYYGAMYGGSTTSILINTPGEASSVMTAIDGYQMAKNGRAGAALAVSAIGSVIAGTFSVIALTLIAVPLANFGLRFGPTEHFSILVFSLSAVASLTGKSVARGLFSMLIGLIIATIGIDLQSGMPRFTGGILELQDGVGFLVAAVGFFAVSEVLMNIEDYLRGGSTLLAIKGKLWLTREEWNRSYMPIIRGTLLGFFKGVIPGGGATISTVLSYSLERSLSKNKDQFGKGAIEGVAGPEAANNAAAGGHMVPLLALGIPTGTTTAILLGAFIIFGIQPGPLLFTRHPDVVWGLIGSMYIGNLMLFVLNLPLIALFVRVLHTPTAILLPIILVVASIGVYSIDSSSFDLAMTWAFGIAGYIFKKAEIPIAPLILAMVLGGGMEQSFRQSMTISSGNASVFLTSWLSLLFLVFAVLMVLGPTLWKLTMGRKKLVAIT
jgi:putative tricarboxylic transport membrane protein